MKSIEGFRIAGQKVTVPGSTGSGMEDYLKRSAGPELLFIAAMAWDMLDMAKRFMTAANKLTLAGDDDRTSKHYCSMFETCVGDGLMFMFSIFEVRSILFRQAAASFELSR